MSQEALQVDRLHGVFQYPVVADLDMGDKVW